MSNVALTPIAAVMLPVALKVNRQVRQAELARLAHLLFRRGPSTSPEEAVGVLIEEIEKLCDRLGIPRRLGQLGVELGQIPALVKSSRGTSMSANPRDVSDEELTPMLEDML